ncbi:hypothetical protein F4859DRAFT_435633 [Xylaria cf. heliscus]|nr:hypothetical protein F4859DRAFT_435633 [Xylaria cf. heliscus]
MTEGTVVLQPPFEHTSIATALKLTHPAIIAYRGALIQPHDGQEGMKAYLEADLKPTRLDKIYKHLHYAGAPRSARPLHRQIILGRKIVITEDVSEHLVWQQSKDPKIFLKPLGAYLLDHCFWKKHLCSDVDLHQSACGLLLSYVWLVTWESDFQIAFREKLLPADLDWNTWTKFVRAFTEVIDPQSLHQVARRYQYGELRLKRLDRIYRYTPTVFSLRNLFNGFMVSSRWYRDVFQDNFGWILAVFAIVSVALSGMQVALMTDQLSHDSRFHRASYGFAVFSLVALAASLGVIIGTWVILTIYFYINAKLYHHHIQSTRGSIIINPVV